MLQSRVNIVVVREIRARIGLDRRDVESMAKYERLNEQTTQNYISENDLAHTNVPGEHFIYNP